MPGISFIFDHDGNLKHEQSQILKSLKSLLHFENYSSKILLNSDKTFLGWTKFNEYPFSNFETDDYLIYLEGKIYGKENSIIKTELKKLGDNIFSGKTNKKPSIIKWLLTTDGDFNLFFFKKKSNEIAILNDVMAHLPLYYYKMDKKIYVSREVRFILNLLDEVKFDKMAIAQYLLFRYSLGKRTIFKNIEKMEPGSLININLKNSNIEISNIHRFNFDVRKNIKNKKEENINQIIKLFNKAVLGRARSMDNYKNVISLSGGFDSRIVFVGLVHSKAPFSCISFMDFFKNASLDVKIAKYLSDQYKRNWKLINLNLPTGKDFLKLLKIKNGLNYLSMGFIVPYFTKLKEIYGPKTILFTGDTGLCLRGLTPNEKVRSIDDLVELIIDHYSQVKLKDVSELTEIDEYKIKEEIRKHIENFPEKDLKEMYIHYIIYEKGFNGHNEGIDRTRAFFWVGTPLESTPFFNYAMNCPDKDKANYKYFSKFFLKVEPKMAAIDYINYRLPITSKKLQFKFFLGSIIDKLPKKTRNSIKKKFYKNYSIKQPPYEDNSNFIKCLREQIDNCKDISNYFPYKNLEEFILNSPKNQVEIFFTIFSTIEEFNCDKSSINNYYNLEFK